MNTSQLTNNKWLRISRAYSIKRKLFFLSYIFVFSFLLWLAISLFIRAKNTQSIDIMQHSQLLQHLADVSTTYTKEFLLTRDIKYHQQIKNTNAEYQNSIQAITNEINSQQLINELTALYSYREKYLHIIDQLVKYHKTRGLNEDTGLRGNLRDKVHNIEDEINKYKNYKLLSQMLMLRRREKDYLIRKNTKYIDKLKTDYQIFLKFVEESPLDEPTKQRIQLLGNDYLNAVLIVVELDNKIVAQTDSLKQINKLIDQKNTSVVQNIIAQNQKFNRLVPVIIIIAAILLSAAIILIFYIIIESIIRPLNQLKISFQNITEGEGDLSRRIPVQSRDEIAQVIEEFNRFISKIDEVIFQVKRLTTIISTDNESLSQAMNRIVYSDNSETHLPNNQKGENSSIMQLVTLFDEVLELVKKQTGSINESLRMLHSISDRSQSIENHVNKTREMSKNAVEAVKKGVKHIEKLNEGIQQVHTSVEQSHQQTERFIEASKKIGDLTISISMLAEQTNTLALNASIIASKAGAKGRGFIVIASEIRLLAEKINSETERIDSIIHTIQSEVATVQNANNEVQKNVAREMELTLLMKNRMSDIIDVTRKNDKEIGKVTVEAKEQANSSTQITSAMSFIGENSIRIEQIGESTKNVSQNISNILVQRLDGIKHLVSLVDKLNQDLNYFKTSKKL